MMKIKNLFPLLLFCLITSSLSAQSGEDYYFSKTLEKSFEEATAAIKASLKEQQFGIITEIDMHEKIAEKVEAASGMKPYRLLGACNPGFAFETVQVEENIGLFLPCKVLVKYIDDQTTEIVAVNPTSLMKMLGNEELMPVADEVTRRFRKALEAL